MLGARPLFSFNFLGCLQQIRKVSTVDVSEVSKFGAIALEWWNPDGPLAPLHRLNPERVRFIKQCLLPSSSFFSGNNLPTCKEFTSIPSALSNLRILDVGCGAGILAESLTRLGAHVLGIDAARASVEVAKRHAKMDPALLDLSYECTTAENLRAEGKQFDVVCALEVIEHVANPIEFLHCCSSLLKGKGYLFLSTLNRTSLSYWLGVVAAERYLNLVAPGTHDWNKFLTPSELSSKVADIGLSIEKVSGIQYNPLTQAAQLSGDTSINYILCARKAERSAGF